MKKLLTGFGVSAILISAVTFSAIAQKENKNNKKEQHQNKGNNQENHGQGQHGNNKNHTGQEGKNQGKHEKIVNTKVEQKLTKWENKVNKGNGNQKDKNNNGRNEEMTSKNNGRNDKDGFNWNDETFNERKKIKNQDKVTICHKVNNDNEPGVAISVSSHAVKAHMNHGDVMGSCPTVQNSRFSNTFLTKRTDYYNTLQKTQEQVLYSRSILDYAILKLTNSRVQLTTLKANNMPAAEIERKQATVVELEQNVSLLETLVGVAANLVINKLQ